MLPGAQSGAIEAGAAACCGHGGGRSAAAPGAPGPEGRPAPRLLPGGGKEAAGGGGSRSGPVPARPPQARPARCPLPPPQVLPLLRALGATGLLLEYEDTFPYAGPLEPLRAPHAYRYRPGAGGGRGPRCRAGPGPDVSLSPRRSAGEVRAVLSQARAQGLEVVPLVQTFGHMEVRTGRAASRLRGLGALGWASGGEGAGVALLGPPPPPVRAGAGVIRLPAGRTLRRRG